MTETISIAMALCKAQASMGKAVKQSENPHLRSKYADLASVMDACMAALNAEGIAVIQPTGEDESGKRYVETVFIHGPTGEKLSCRVPLIVSKNDMQGFGSAVTYARRYGLMTMAGIAPEDDDGQAAAQAAPKSAPQGEAIAHAREYLKQASDLKDLQRRWNNTPGNIKHHVENIKNEMKAALAARHADARAATYNVLDAVRDVADARAAAKSQTADPDVQGADPDIDDEIPY